jgi:hypothetical protein
MNYYELNIGDEFTYDSNDGMNTIPPYLAKRQEDMFGKTYVKMSQKYAYEVDGNKIKWGFLHTFDGKPVLTPTDRHYDLVLEQVLTQLKKPLDEYIYYMESQTGKRSENHCDFRTSANWGHGVFAEDPTTGERFCLRSDYDSSG